MILVRPVPLTWRRLKWGCLMRLSVLLRNSTPRPVRSLVSCLVLRVGQLLLPVIIMNGGMVLVTLTVLLVTLPSGRFKLPRLLTPPTFLFMFVFINWFP